MNDSGTLSIDSADGHITWRLAGAWRLAWLAELERELARSARPATIDGSALTELDSAAAMLLGPQ
ncbi:MAG: hypothetical protein JNK55_09255 [Rubrivivax sp.]|nr:hypothetical protein [Rubrivivax sp.]